MGGARNELYQRRGLGGKGRAKTKDVFLGVACQCLRNSQEGRNDQPCPLVLQGQVR